MAFGSEWMAWFGAFRGNYGFSWYSDNPTAASVDIPLAAVTYFCVLVSVATLIASLGIRGKDRWSTALRAIYGLSIGSIILVGAYSHHWQSGSIKVATPYVYRSTQKFEGTVGILVALHGANVTLEGQFGSESHKGHVFYSEALPWTDFGRESASFHGYLDRGLPDPILKVAEYLCTDAGGLRWGKTFHIAGNFACALLWTAFAFWVVSNILLFSVICYGGYMFGLTGFTMVLSCVVYHACQPRNQLFIRFGDQLLTTHYDWTFWLILVSGIVTFVLGVLLIFLEHLFPKKLSEFFCVDAGIEDDKGDISTFTSIRHPERRRSGFPLDPSQRRGSIFNEPASRRGSLYAGMERRGSVFADGQRRSSFFGNSSFYLNKGYMSDEKIKCNPIFNGRDSITEEDEHLPVKQGEEIKITIEEDGCSTISGSDRKSSATENRDNDLNEKQAASSVCVEVGRFSRQGSHDSGNDSGCVQAHDSDCASAGDVNTEFEHCQETPTS